MRRMYEFQCMSCQVVFEALTDESHTRTTHWGCLKYDRPVDHSVGVGQRIISAPRINLEGISGSFPTATDRWVKVHEEAARVANKQQEGKYQE